MKSGRVLFRRYSIIHLGGGTIKSPLWTGWHRGNALGSYSGNASFESRPGHAYPYWSLSWFSLVPLDKCWNSMSGHDRFLSNRLQFILPFDPIATGYGLHGRGVGVRVPVGARFFLLSTSSRPVLKPTQPPMQKVPVALCLGVIRPGREADHSPPTSVEVRNTGRYKSTHPYVFMA
jgi:hypothetical protein